MATALSLPQLSQTFARSSSPFRPFSGPSASPSRAAPAPVTAPVPQIAVSATPSSSGAPSATCTHMAHALLSAPATLASYTLAMKWGRKRESNALKGKQSSSKCATCGHAPLRAAICLECGDVFCLSGHHARRHLDKSRHRFYVDTHSGAVFCHSCKDTAFHPLLQSALASCSSDGTPAPSSGAKRKRTDYKPYRNNAETKVLIAQSSKVRSCDNIRGIRNLGATCFLNVVLQALLHNPVLRGYYLADRHNAASCPIASSSTSSPCMSCEVDRIFTEVFSDTSRGTPYGPTSMLQTSWQSFKDLAGYSQQDAHEYLIAALDAMHKTTPGCIETEGCLCAVHTTFAGQLRSDVKCGRCNNVTTSLDPFLDLSLDIRSPAATASTAGAEAASTLFSCLDRYTSSEKLGAKQYSCTSCGTSTTDASKQLSINRLPPVLCIQLKRFEHAAGSRKIDTRVRFPLELDMSPYTAGRNVNNAKYELFAVITHEGKLDTGHYYIHARRRDNWTLINDDVVTPASLSSVLSTNPYLLFYAAPLNFARNASA